MYTGERLIIEKKNNTSILEVGCVCGAFILILSLATAAITYLVFGIIFLVKDYDIANNCKGSSLWEYILTAIILAFFRGYGRNVKDNNDKFNFFVLIFLGLIEAGLAIWGGIELFNKSCDNIVNNNLWKFGLATFIIQTFLATICLIIIPLFTICCEMYINYCEKKETSNIDTANLV